LQCSVCAFLQIIDLVGVASANLRPTKLNNFASIPSRDFTSAQLQHPARRPSNHLHAPRFLPALGPIYRIRSGSVLAAPTVVRLHLPGTKLGSTPCGSRQPLEWRPLQEPRKTLFNTRQYVAQCPVNNRSSQSLDIVETATEGKGRYRRFQVVAAVVAANVGPDPVRSLRVIGLVHSCPYSMQTKGESITVFV
jgi:hypothetical protein